MGDRLIKAEDSTCGYRPKAGRKLQAFLQLAATTITHLARHSFLVVIFAIMCYESVVIDMAVEKTVIDSKRVTMWRVV